MKLTKLFTCFLALGALSSLPAQQAGLDPTAPTLMATVQPKNGKSTATIRLLQPTTVVKNELFYQVSNNDDPRPGKVKDFKVFLIMTPPELAEAMQSYAEGNLPTAKKQLATARTKYQNFAGLPNNPSLIASMLEINCLARLQDWDGLYRATEKFPRTSSTSAQRATVEAATLLSRVSDDAGTGPTRQKDLENFMADSAKMKNIRTMEYGWLKYALGRAIACRIPSGDLTADKMEVAGKAADAYCEAAMCFRGRAPELAADALQRAFRLLWAAPGVKSYGSSVKKMDLAKWNAAPAEFRDAVAIAYMVTNIINPELKDDAMRTAAGFFFNAQQGKKPADADKPAK